MYSRLDTFMNAEQVPNHINWQLDEKLGEIRREFKEDFFRLKEEVNVMGKSLQLPGLIGDSCKYPTITDFLVMTFRDNNYLFEMMDKDLKRIEEVEIKELRIDVDSLKMRTSDLQRALDSNVKDLRVAIASECDRVELSLTDKLDVLGNVQRGQGIRLRETEDDIKGMKTDSEKKQDIISLLLSDVGQCKITQEDHIQKLAHISTEMSHHQRQLTKLDRA